jgi:hypothetical protein
MEAALDEIADQGWELEKLTRQLRTESVLLSTLRAEAGKVEDLIRAGRTPFIGPAYVAGLVLGMPFWWLVFLTVETAGR